MSIQFGELPPEPVDQYRRHLAWRDEAAALKDRPGAWAKMTTKTTIEQARTLVYSIRHAQLAAFRPAGQFEATWRGCDVWVRYVDDLADYRDESGRVRADPQSVDLALVDELSRVRAAPTRALADRRLDT